MARGDPESVSTTFWADPSAWQGAAALPFTHSIGKGPMTDASLRPAGSFRLLVAEDEPHTRRILITMFEASGFQLDVVSDGATALGAVRSETPFDLIILDIVMPNASGLEVLRELRTLPHRRTVPVIVLTAKGQDVDRDEAFALGANQFFTKPFSPKKLVNQVDELLASR